MEIQFNNNNETDTGEREEKKKTRKVVQTNQSVMENWQAKIDIKKFCVLSNLRELWVRMFLVTCKLHKVRGCLVFHPRENRFFTKHWKMKRRKNGFFNMFFQFFLSLSRARLESDGKSTPAGIYHEWKKNYSIFFVGLARKFFPYTSASFIQFYFILEKSWFFVCSYIKNI